MPKNRGSYLAVNPGRHDLGPNLGFLVRLKLLSGISLLRDLRKNKIPGDPPPSPQVWGNRAIQRPPDLGA